MASRFETSWRTGRCRRAAPSKPRRTQAWRAAAIAALLLASILAAALIVLRAPFDAPTTRFVIVPPPNETFTLLGRLPQSMMVAVSPDGRHLLYVATGAGVRARLWVRSIDALEAKPIDGTDGVGFAFWSPDSKSIAFFAGETLKRTAGNKVVHVPCPSFITASTKSR